MSVKSGPKTVRHVTFPFFPPQHKTHNFFVVRKLKTTENRVLGTALLRASLTGLQGLAKHRSHAVGEEAQELTPGRKHRRHQAPGPGAVGAGRPEVTPAAP